MLPTHLVDSYKSLSCVEILNPKTDKLRIMDQPSKVKVTYLEEITSSLMSLTLILYIPIVIDLFFCCEDGGRGITTFSKFFESHILDNELRDIRARKKLYQ